MRTPAPPATPGGGVNNSRSSGNGGGRAASERGDRERNDRPAVGSAVPRSGIRPGPGGNGSVYVPSPYVNSWGPDRYGSYYGYPYYSYPYYSPFLYGSSRWSWTRYGIWYDPFSPFAYSSLYFDPFYGPAGYGGGYSVYPGNFYEEPTPGSSFQEPEATGSIRVRVKPVDGKVYLDGTFMGVVDQFDGLTDHLATTAGSHQIEIRADGYQPLTLSVDVEPDRTITARGTLKKM
jgi:hypothetical protein